MNLIALRLPCGIRQSGQSYLTGPCVFSRKTHSAVIPFTHGKDPARSARRTVTFDPLRLYRMIFYKYSTVFVQCQDIFFGSQKNVLQNICDHGSPNGTELRSEQDAFVIVFVRKRGKRSVFGEKIQFSARLVAEFRRGDIVG